MALSLGVHAGSALKVGDTRIEITSVGPGETMWIVVQGRKEPFNVSSEYRVEILPKVYVSVGRSANTNQSPRLCFEADKSIPITRLT